MKNEVKEKEETKETRNKAYDDTNSKIVVITVSILAVILAVYLGVVVWVYCFNDGKLPGNSSDKEVVEKRKTIDVNGDLAQALYNKVSGELEGTYPVDWMITQYKDTFGNFIVADATEEDKMRLVGYNTDESQLKYLSTVEFKSLNIPEKNNKGQYADYAGRPIAYYEKSYIENIYERLYGKESKLNTNVNMMITVYQDTYTYIPALDGYLKYESIGKGGIGPVGENTIIKLGKAYEDGNKVELYEDIYVEYYNMDTNTYTGKEKKYTFKYTFEKDNDIYKFVSRKKM